MSLTIQEFDIYPVNGEVQYPAKLTTRITTAAQSHTTQPSTRVVVITTDADTRVAFDGAAATAYDVPVLTYAENIFFLAPGSAHTLKFL